MADIGVPFNDNPSGRRCSTLRGLPREPFSVARTCLTSSAAQPPPTLIDWVHHHQQDRGRDAGQETIERAYEDRREGKSHSAELDYERGHDGARSRRPSGKRSQATEKALKQEGHAAASPEALASQARSAAKHRTIVERSPAAKKAARNRHDRNVGTRRRSAHLGMTDVTG